MVEPEPEPEQSQRHQPPRRSGQVKLLLWVGFPAGKGAVPKLKGAEKDEV